MCVRKTFSTSFVPQPAENNTFEGRCEKEEAYVLMFDESLNSMCQSKQIDIHIRSWNQDKQEVESRYYTSVFMGHGTTDDMLSHFRTGIEGIPLK